MLGGSRRLVFGAFWNPLVFLGFLCFIGILGVFIKN